MGSLQGTSCYIYYESNCTKDVLKKKKFVQRKTCEVTFVQPKYAIFHFAHFLPLNAKKIAKDKRYCKRSSFDESYYKNK